MAKKKNLTKAEQKKAHLRQGRMERVGEDFKKKRVFPVGPADPAVAKVNDIYKKVIYIKTKDYQTLVELKDRLEHYMRDNRAFKDTVVQFDFNPMSGF